MDLNAVPGELLLAIFIVFFIAVFGGAIYFMLRQVRQRRQAIIARGLTPQKPPDPALVQRMRRLRPDVRVENVYCLERGAYRLYLFELWSSQSSDDSPSSYNAVALISPDFRLPRFNLTANIRVRGLGKLMAWGMNQYMRRYHLQRFTFPESPVFDQEYVLLGQDEPALRDWFTLERLNRLATAAQHFMIEGQDDLLTFTRADTQFRSTSDVSRIDALLEGAAVLYAIFRD